MGILKLLIAVSCAVLVLGCRNKKESKDSAIFFTGTAIEWIGDGRPLPHSDSLFYLDRPAPLFRKEFTAGGQIVQAKLMITAAGYYRAILNGISIGDHLLDPAWTDYSKRIYYTEYDVTSMLRQGDNCIGITLGNGFYNPLPLRKWGRRNLREDLTVGKPTFISKIIIKYENGESEEIVSDTSWKYTYGPVTKNSVYIGITYDARNEKKGWTLPGFDDSQWEFAEKVGDQVANCKRLFSLPLR